MKFILDVTVADSANPFEVAVAILDYLCSEDTIVDVFSYDAIEPVRPGHPCPELDRYAEAMLAWEP